MQLVNLPKGTTHTSNMNVRVQVGGMCIATFYCFKYVNNQLMVYVTDNDNEYPQWILASNRFSKPPELVRCAPRKK